LAAQRLGGAYQRAVARRHRDFRAGIFGRRSGPATTTACSAAWA
jgi:hypothetical protein